jgi:hypothetical protein
MKAGLINVNILEVRETRKWNREDEFLTDYEH